MSSSSDAVTGASGKGDAILLIKLSVGIAEAHARTDLVGVPASGGIEAIQEADIEHDSARIVADEVFITVTA
jgi:hypothetical protein